jgi:hypothetical protein
LHLFSFVFSSMLHRNLWEFWRSASGLGRVKTLATPIKGSNDLPSEWAGRLVDLPP